MTGLLYVPDQVAGESLRGYLRRLAIGNGYAGSRELVQAVGFKFTNTALANDIGAILNALGVSPRNVHFASTGQTSRLADQLYERTKYEPVCVKCLHDSEHLKQVWSHCLVVACPVHQCMLIDRCPQCQEMLKTTRMGIATCDCGFDLRYANPTTATPIQSWSSARLVGDMRPIRLVDEIGNEDDYHHLADLVFQLAIRFDQKSKNRRGSATRPKTVDDATSLIRPVLAMFEDLHPRLTAHIEQRFAAGNQNAFNLSERFGAWYGALNKICRKAKAFPIIWEIFSDAVCDLFDGHIRGEVGLMPSPGKQRQYLSLGEAATLIGVSKPLLKDAIQRNQIQVRVGSEGPSRTIYMISRQECLAAQQVRQDWMSRRAAGIYLGVPRGTLQHLINADIVTPDEKWDQSIFKSGPISREQLAMVLEKMTAAIEVRPAARTLKLDQINAKLTGDSEALPRLYRAIYSGELQPIGRDGEVGLAGLIFASVEVDQYLGSSPLNNTLTLDQVAQVNGWKYQSVAGWTKQNLLESEFVVLDGRRARVVTLKSLSTFRRQWIPVAEIAAAMGSKGSAVTKHLASKGIPIVGQTYEVDGAARGGLIRISDLGRLAGLVGSISRKSNETLRGEHVD